MNSDQLSELKFKCVCTDFPNPEVLAKIATHRDIQVTYAHTFIGNKYLGKMVTALILVGYLEAPTAVLIDAEHAFAGYGKKIRIPMTDVLLRAAAANLDKSKKLRYWTSRNAILILPFLTDSVVADRETTAEALLKIST